VKVIIYFAESLGKYVVGVTDKKGNLKGGEIFDWTRVSRGGLRYEIELAPPAKFAAALRLAGRKAGAE